LSARGPLPTAGFARVDLDLSAVPAGRRFGRIFLDRYPDPLGYGKARSRFADPRRRVSRSRFGVLYLGESLKVCFLEAMLRDRRNGAVGDYPIAESDFRVLRFAEVEVAAALSLADLRGDGPVRMGIPSDVLRASSQSLGRAWSLALYQHPAQPDGIIYPSRLNDETNLAIYDRAVAKLRPVRNMPLIEAPGLAQVLDDLRVALA
jgi:hypothetical protein